MEKLTKDDVLNALNAVIGVRETHFDGDWVDIELGFPWYDVSEALNKKPEIFEDIEVKELLGKAVKATEELVTNNSDFYERLEETFMPGQELFPDPKKHYWWWIPEKVMNEEQLKEWKKYLKKRGYK